MRGHRYGSVKALVVPRKDKAAFDYSGGAVAEAKKGVGFAFVK